MELRGRSSKQTEHVATVSPAGSGSWGGSSRPVCCRTRSLSVNQPSWARDTSLRPGKVCQPTDPDPRPRAQQRTRWAGVQQAGRHSPLELAQEAQRVGSRHVEDRGDALDALVHLAGDFLLVQDVVHGLHALGRGLWQGLGQRARSWGRRGMGPAQSVAQGRRQHMRPLMTYLSAVISPLSQSRGR